jgi:hypothetical protein
VPFSSIKDLERAFKTLNIPEESFVNLSPSNLHLEHYTPEKSVSKKSN